MLHEFDVGTCVSLQCIAAERRNNFNALTILYLHARKALLIGFHPRWHETGYAILPAAEPQKHNMLVVLARARDQAIYQREIKSAFLRFDPVPAHRKQHSIDIQAGQFRPHTLHELQARRSSAAQFCAKNQIRLAIHHQLRGYTAPFQMRNRCRSLCAQR